MCPRSGGGIPGLNDLPESRQVRVLPYNKHMFLAYVGSFRSSLASTSTPISVITCKGLSAMRDASRHSCAARRHLLATGAYCSYKTRKRRQGTSSALSLVSARTITSVTMILSSSTTLAMGAHFLSRWDGRRRVNVFSVFPHTMLALKATRSLALSPTSFSALSFSVWRTPKETTLY